MSNLNFRLLLLKKAKDGDACFDREHEEEIAGRASKALFKKPWGI